MCQWQHPMKTQHFQEPQQVKQGTETNRMELNKESRNSLPSCAEGRMHRLFPQVVF